MSWSGKTTALVLVAAVAVLSVAGCRPEVPTAPAPTPVSTTLPWDSTGNVTSPVVETIRLARSVCGGAS